MKADVLVVGGGLAGVTLAWALRVRGQSVVVVDSGRGGAWSVASGLVNPLSGPRLVPVWMAEAAWAALVAWHRSVAAEAGRSFFTVIPVLRRLATGAEQTAAARRAASGGLRGWVGRVDSEEVEIVRAGRVAVGELVSWIRGQLSAAGAWREAEVEPESVTWSADGRATWADVEATWVVFCGGWSPVLARAWFPGIPWAPSRGEVLDVEAPGVDRGAIPHDGRWAVPAAEGVRWRIGATHDVVRLDAGVTRRGREELERAALGLLRAPFAVAGHLAGVRPAVGDRAPVIGAVPGRPRLAILGGLGGRGAFLAPLLAELTCGWMGGAGLPREVAVTRFR